MKQEFVTLPREVVERAIDALYCTNSKEGSPAYNFELKAIKELRAALEQPQNHVPDVGNMVQSGWKLVPDEPTCGMVLAGEHSMKQHDFFRLDAGYRAMLAAAPQPPTTEQSSVVQQPQGEQEPVAYLNKRGFLTAADAVSLYQYGKMEQWVKAYYEPLYTRPHPQREPLTDEQVAEAWIVYTGIGKMRPHHRVFNTEAEAKTFAIQIKSNTKIYQIVHQDQQTKRDPLTDDQIEKICPLLDDPMRREMWKIGFKAAHNIK